MTLAEAVAFIRPVVRAGQAYHVGGPPRAHIKLNQNESPFDLPADLKRELIERFWSEPFNRYPLIHPEPLTHALGIHMGWDASGILVGNGSNELMSTVMQVLVSTDSAVVLPRPMFSFYARLAELSEARRISVPPRADLSFDAKAIAQMVHDHNAALVVLTTPNNPTGLAMTLDEVLAVLEAAPGFVLVDEAYGEFNPEESALSVLKKYPNLLILRTFSKAFGLAGLRLGYLVGHPNVIHEVMKARVPFMVDRLAEMTALALLERRELIDERIRHMKYSTQWLSEMLDRIPGVTTMPSQANFVLFRTQMEPRPLHDALVHHGILVRSMDGYPELQGYLRVNAGTKKENNAFIRILTDVLGKG